MKKLWLSSLLLCSMGVFGQSISDYVTQGAFDHYVPNLPGRTTTLFSSMSGIDGNAFATISQRFTDDGLNNFSTFGADDFTVPGCGWRIDAAEFAGVYSNNLDPNTLGPATSFNVYIIAKTGDTLTSTDLDATATFAGTNLNYTDLGDGDVRVELPGVVLAKGDYWIVAQANMDFLVGGQWNWTESADAPNSGVPIGSESNWFQTTDGYVNSPETASATCIDGWGRRLADCSITRFPDSAPPGDPDYAFALEGALLSASTATDPSSLNTIEDGAPITYEISFASPPAPGETVTVDISSDDLTEGTVSPASASVTSANWMTPIEVTVTPGASGDGNDGDVAYTISNGLSSDDPAGCYHGATIPDISVTNQNIEGIATILIEPTVGLEVSEDGSQATFTVSTSSTPTADVNIPLVNNTPAEISLSTSTVSLTAGNGYSATVTVTGVNDDVVDGPIPFTISTNASSSTDLAFSSIDPADVAGENLDNDVAEVIVTPAQSPLSTDETGTSDSIEYVLSAQPTSDVTFDIQSDDEQEANVNFASLTFTSANWNVSQQVTVTGANDFQQDGIQTYNIISTPTTSTDPFWDGVNVASVAGENADDLDAAGIILQGGDLNTGENGDYTDFTVVLASEPFFDVFINISSGDPSEGLIDDGTDAPANSARLTFDSDNWNAPQTLRLVGVNDDEDDGNVIFPVTLDPTESADPSYEVLNLPSLVATNIDNDFPDDIESQLPFWADSLSIFNFITLLNQSLLQTNPSTVSQLEIMLQGESTWQLAPDQTSLPVGTEVRLRFSQYAKADLDRNGIVDEKDLAQLHTKGGDFNFNHRLDEGDVAFITYFLSMNAPKLPTNTSWSGALPVDVDDHNTYATLILKETGTHVVNLLDGEGEIIRSIHFKVE